MREQISLDALLTMSDGRFDGVVKAVVDVERRIMAVDAELHADEEKELLLDGSAQEALWGIAARRVSLGDTTGGEAQIASGVEG